MEFSAPKSFGSEHDMYKYEIIAQDIQSKILSGFYKPDEKLPQELELCKQYDASRITIREPW